MQEIIFENEYTQIFIDQEQSIYGYRWKSTNRSLIAKSYQEEIKRHGDNILHYRPANVLVDFRDSNFVIDPDLQGFVKTEMFDKMNEVGTHKLAIIQTQDYIMQLSVSQTIQEQTSARYITEYFATTDKALEWFAVPKH